MAGFSSKQISDLKTLNNETPFLLISSLLIFFNIDKLNLMDFYHKLNAVEVVSCLSSWYYEIVYRKPLFYV